jgi:uncharacterized protein
MAQTPPELKRIISRYKNELEKMGLQVEKILLYGSQATGTMREGSDIDLFVISPDWKIYGQRERLEMLGVAAARILEPIQAQGFTPDEIANQKITAFWQHVMTEQAIVV